MKLDSSLRLKECSRCFFLLIYKSCTKAPFYSKVTVLLFSFLLIMCHYHLHFLFLNYSVVWFGIDLIIYTGDVDENFIFSEFSFTVNQRCHL